MKPRKRNDIKSFTCPEKIYEAFINHCEENKMNRSQVIRKLIVKYLEEQKK